MSALVAWWRQADHYDWLSGYLASRGLQKMVRTMAAASTMILSSITLAMTWSPAGPHRRFGEVAALIAVAICMGLALMWAFRWPTRWQSVGYAVTALACTAVVCVSYADPLFGLIGCMTFGVVGGYIAFFHTSRLLMLNLAVAATTTLLQATTLAQASGDDVRAVCAFLIVGVSIVSAPFAGQALVYYLAVDVMSSDVDPLCGLLNRRAFYRCTRDLVAGQTATGAGYLTVTMLDLDNFKKVNDTHGHAVGDRALIAVGDVLRRTANDSAVLARVGGEEFLVADIIAAAPAVRRAERLRIGIACTTFGITASVGVASAPLRTGCVLGREVIDKLIITADAAMYDAKRAGGNQIRHRETTAAR